MKAKLKEAKLYVKVKLYKEVKQDSLDGKPTHLCKFNPEKEETHIDYGDISTFFSSLKFASQKDRNKFLKKYGKIAKAKYDSNNEVVFIWANEKGDPGLYFGYEKKYTIEFNDAKLATEFVNFCNLGNYTTIFQGKVGFNEQDTNVTEIPLSGANIVGDN